jgi:hypothetical protein
VAAKREPPVRSSARIDSLRSTRAPLSAPGTVDREIRERV